jgi:phosphatidylinositol alpha-mannosyltransferase
MIANAGATGLKIGLVLDASLDPTDGVQQYVISIGEWLRGQGHDVHYLVGQTARRDLPNVHSLARNVGVVFNGNRTTIPLPPSRGKLRRFLDDQRFDVLHVQTPHSPFMSQRLILGADKRTAVIGTFHILPYGWLPSIGNRLLGVWLGPSLKRFDEIVSVSVAAAGFANQSFGIQTDVLPNVIDYRRFSQAEPLPAYDDDRLTILFLGRLVPRKGCQLLLEAINLLKNEDLPAFRVVICGRGPLESKLKQYVEQKGLSAKVEFTGFVSEADKPSYYASADISVFPSSGGESFGIVLLEAMAGGRSAVLAGDNPGYRSVMSPRPELLFNAKEAAELAAKLRQYLTNSSKRRQMAAWGGGYAAGFDVDTVGRKLLKVYERALRKRARL